MLLTSVVATAALATFAKGAALARSDACTIKQVGFFQALGTNVSLNANQELITGDSLPFIVSYQACPSAPQNIDFDSVGRIVAQIAGQSTEKCLTIADGSAATGPYTAKLETCTSDSNPSSAQLWGYGNDFGDVIFALGTNQCASGGAGFYSDPGAQGADGSLVRIGCPDTVGSSYGSFNVNSTNNS
ncbi:hypothetical protein FIBSPDRAFT_1039469 [Athelia psychrophila]|uniref:Uncharacterized protein n=1 Tax=Athelia psychrophila TaxID=1759441 RepID=A0A166RWJ8_9AGAM|nr:hypothetical protein FIBSPDRAFT_1039469 [Fibularhizoctonia sp. CBS 109695]